MDEYRKKILEKLKRDRGIIKKVKEEYGQEYTKLEDKTKYKTPVAAEQKPQDIKAAIYAAYENQKDINCILEVLHQLFLSERLQ